MSGYMKMYAILKQSSFTLQKDKTDKEGQLKIPLSQLQVENNAKDHTEFILNFTDQKDKKAQKIFMKATDQKERDKWVQSIQDFVNKLKLDIDVFAMDDPLVQPFKDNLYEAFSSKFFVDECDLETKLQAYTEVEKLFQTDCESLMQIVKTLLPDDSPNQ